MKTKIITIILFITLIAAGVVGLNLLLKEKDSGIMVTTKNTIEKNNNEIAKVEEQNNSEITESKVEEKIDGELEFEMQFIEDLNCQKNTYIGVTSKYKDEYYDILEKYCTDYTSYGDSAAWLESESNYEQYTQLYGKGFKIEKIEDNINVKLAIVHESTCNLPKFNENMTLQEILKLQSKEGTEAGGDLIGKDGYYEITGMLIMNGNNTSEEEWKNNSRAKKISVIIDGEEEFGFELEDTMEAQLIDLSYRHDGLDTPIDVEIKVLETYEGNVSDDVYISDIRFGLDTSMSRGR